jgi:transposase-like protein
MKEADHKDPRWRRYTLEEKKEILELWKISNLSKINFCKEHGIAPSTLHKWLNPLSETLQSSIIHLTPVSVVNKKELVVKEETEQTLIELSLPSQSVMRFKLPIKDLVLFVTELTHATATIR